MPCCGSDDTPIDLGFLGGPASGASAINDHGDVSGTAVTADGSPQAFLWKPENRKLVQLEPPAGFVAAINGCCKTINDRREIVGWMFSGEVHAFLATPCHHHEGRGECCDNDNH